MNLEVNNPIVIEGDSFEYEILESAAQDVSSLDSPTIELGVRKGYGSAVIMKYNSERKFHICIDPYGSIPYVSDVHGTFLNTEYGNKMRRETLYALYRYAHENNKNLLFFVLEDTEFFKRFADGFPYYEKDKIVYTKYSLVHFDGPHNIKDILIEIDFFKDRIETGGIFVFDDIDNYDHDKVEKQVLDLGFTIFKKGVRKAAYKKV